MWESITTNSFLSMVITTIVVVAVLLLLRYVIKRIHYANKTVKRPSSPASSGMPNQMDERTLVAVLTTAIMAYGYKNVRVTSIKRL
jgi:Na+-transporting methylmalonyl-CoA/oxaloacetate decarboxylase gamma subunit